MPRGDRTGSMGQGSRTVRGLGFCKGFDSPGFIKGAGCGKGRGSGYGRGMGMGMGMGRGMDFGRGRNFGGANAGSISGNPWMPSMSKEDEVKLLKSRSEALSRSQKDIEKRLGELQ